MALINREGLLCNVHHQNNFADCNGSVSLYLAPTDIIFGPIEVYLSASCGISDSLPISVGSIEATSVAMMFLGVALS